MFERILVLCLLAVSLSCSETDIPQTAAQPFNLSRIRVSNDITPEIGTTLRKGTSFSFSFDLIYTVSEEALSIDENVFVFIDFEGFDADDNFTNIQPFPDLQFAVEELSEKIPISLPVTIPGDNPLVEAELFVALIDSNSRRLVGARHIIRWPVE